MKNKKNKIISIILSFVFVLGLTGCGGEVRRADGSQEEYEYLITVGFAQGGEEGSWKTANTESFQTIFVEDNGYELLLEDAGIDQEKQIHVIREFIEKEVDYILLAPVAEYGLEEVLEEAKEARIPVLLVGALNADIDSSLYECQICSNTEKQVQEMGNWLETYLEERENKGENKEVTDNKGYTKKTKQDRLKEEEKQRQEEKAKQQKSGGGETDESKEEQEEEKEAPYILAVVQDYIGTARQLTLAEGYQKLIEKHSDWQMEGQQTGENSREIAKQVVELFIEHYPELNIIIAETSDMALGVVDALEEHKKNQQSEADDQEEVILISLGAGREVLEAVRDGKIQAAFEQTPLQAPKTAEIIQKLESGIYLDKIQYVKDVYYDQTMNLEEVIAKQTY
ncbi:substrate-binding domain-containing protein [Roseburia hominis]